MLPATAAAYISRSSSRALRFTAPTRSVDCERNDDVCISKLTSVCVAHRETETAEIVTDPKHIQLGI